MLVIKLTICMVVVILVVDQASSSSIDLDVVASGRRAPRSVAQDDEIEEISQIGRNVRELIKEEQQRTRRIQSKNWSPRKRTGGLMFTEWSIWSVCDDTCRQKRERYCKILRKCADTKHVEERRCQHCKERLAAPMTPISANSNGIEDGTSADKVVSKFDMILNKFIHKLGGDATAVAAASPDEMDHHESEFRIVKINQKKKPEIQANKYDFAQPVMLGILHIENPPITTPSPAALPTTTTTALPTTTTTAPVMPVSNNSSPAGSESNLLDIFAISKFEHEEEDFLEDYNDDYGDNDYAMDVDTKLVYFKRKMKNAQKKYAQSPPATNFVSDPLGRGVYTRWSKWTKCSAKCTTRRFKKCRMREICANAVLREVAFCYTEQSFCEEWIVRQMYNNVAGKPSQSQLPVMSDPKTPSALPHTQTTTALARNSLYQERKLPARLPGGSGVPPAGQCGVSAVAHKGRKLPASHMLRIIGGKIVRRGSYPWQVAILNRFKEAFCGGTLISKQWILTAAHCVRKRLYVRLGEHNLEQRDGTEVEYRVEYAIKYPYYDKTTVDNDIALLRLPKEIIPSAYIGFACLPQKQQKLPVGSKCTVIGWGKRKNLDDAGTKYLHEAQVPIVTNAECKLVYNDYTITKNMFCAGHARGRIDTCAGDSGGPLLCKDPSGIWSIFGVTSFGDGCGKRNKFGIYTKVSNYVEWIQSVIDCNGNCRRF